MICVCVCLLAGEVDERHEVRAVLVDVSVDGARGFDLGGAAAEGFLWARYFSLPFVCFVPAHAVEAQAPRLHLRASRRAGVAKQSQNQVRDYM